MEKAPWWAGFWERMVQGVKRCLRKTVGHTSLTYDQLLTLLIEVKAVINAHPFTYVQDDVDGINYTLSISYLIYGGRIAEKPNDSHYDISSTHATLTRSYKTQKHLLNQFTRQWRKEHLTGLRESHRTNSRWNGFSEITVGVVGVLKDDSTKRVFWKLGVVEELVTGRHNKIRVALVRVGSSDNSTHFLKHSILHLYPVELRNRPAASQYWTFEFLNYVVRCLINSCCLKHGKCDIYFPFLPCN